VRQRADARLISHPQRDGTAGLDTAKLDQITGLNAATGDLIQRTSEQLKIQGAQINEQAASATVSVEKLQAAFDNVFQTMDAVDNFRAQAVDSMAQTVNALQSQIERAQPYLERVRRNELSSGS